MAALLDTPERVLERVQLYEDMELPSLPSFQHEDMDLSGDVVEADHSHRKRGLSASPIRNYDPHESISSAQSTPVVARNRQSPKTASTARTESTVKPTWASPNYRDSLSKGCELLKRSVTDEISLLGDVESRLSLSLAQDTSHYQYPAYTLTADLSSLSSANNDGGSDQYGSLSPPLSATPMPIPRYSANMNSRVPPMRALPASPTGSRIPSLSLTEASATDNEATTPDAPLHLSCLPAVTASISERSMHPVDSPPSSEVQENSAALGDSGSARLRDTESTSPSASETPIPIRYMDVPSTAARAAATPFPTTSALRGNLPFRRNTHEVPLEDQEPSSESAIFPPAPLDDAARRKSHVLSVLASATLPSRVRKRMTPCPPQTHVDVKSPQSGQPAMCHSPSVVDEAPQEHDAEETQSSVSYVSIASSQDLAVERAWNKQTLHRGNTSVPDVLLGAVNLGMSGNLNLENRPDTVKIHKHLNMMNRQLLDTNADLAREAQTWRDECHRLLSILEDAHIESDTKYPMTQAASPSVAERTHDQRLTASANSWAPLAARCQPSQAGSEEDQGSLAQLRSALQEKDRQLRTLQIQFDEERSQLNDKTQLKALEESQAALAQLQQDYAAKTEEYARQFARICDEFETQIGQLQTELRIEKETNSGLRQRLSPESAVHVTPEGEGMRRAQREEEDDFAREPQTLRDLKQAQTQLVELQAREEATMCELDDAKRLIRELERQTGDGTRTGICQDGPEGKPASLTGTTLCSSRKGTCPSEFSDALSALERQLLERERVVESQQRTIQELQLGVSDAEDNGQRVRELEHHLSEAQAAGSKAIVEVEALRARVSTLEAVGGHNDSGESGTTDNNSFIATLEDRLDEAHREIGRLKSERDATPARLSAIQSRDTRISALEAEKEALLERLAQRQNLTPLRWAMRASTPVVHKAITSLRSPLTPGPLKECSWLQSSADDSNGSFLRDQLEQLQQELDHANDQLDKNFDRLEEAGVGAVQLAQKLATAHDNIYQLEEEVRTLRQEKIHSKHELTAGRTRNEQLEVALDAVREQLSRLQHDMVAEKDRLQEDNRRLRLQHSDMRLKFNDEMDSLKAQLASVEEDASEHKDNCCKQLRAVSLDKETLEERLRGARAHNAALETDIQQLQSKMDTMSRKRGTVGDDSGLKTPTSGTTLPDDIVLSLQAQLSEAQTALVHERQLLDMLREQQRHEVSARHQAETRLEGLEVNRARAAEDLLAFQTDLSKQRRECARFQAELNTLRQQQGTAITRKTEDIASLEDQLRIANDQLSHAAQKAERAQGDLLLLQAKLNQQEAHQQNLAAEQRRRYKSQTARLSAQIRYLKAKYARENTFRNGLSLQKKFLLLLVGGMSLNEQATLRIIASLGCEVPQTPRSPPSFKAVALAVVSLIRARRVADQWKSTRIRRDEALGR